MVDHVLFGEAVELVPHPLHVIAQLRLERSQGTGTGGIGPLHSPAPHERRRVDDGRVTLRTEAFRPECPLLFPGLDDLLH